MASDPHASTNPAPTPSPHPSHPASPPSRPRRRHAHGPAATTRNGRSRVPLRNRIAASAHLGSLATSSRRTRRAISSIARSARSQRWPPDLQISPPSPTTRPLAARSTRHGDLDRWPRAHRWPPFIARTRPNSRPLAFISAATNAHQCNAHTLAIDPTLIPATRAARSIAWRTPGPTRGHRCAGQASALHLRPDHAIHREISRAHRDPRSRDVPDRRRTVVDQRGPSWSDSARRAQDDRRVSLAAITTRTHRNQRPPHQADQGHPSAGAATPPPSGGRNRCGGTGGTTGLTTHLPAHGRRRPPDDGRYSNATPPDSRSASPVTNATPATRGSRPRPLPRRPGPRPSRRRIQPLLTLPPRIILPRQRRRPHHRSRRLRLLHTLTTQRHIPRHHLTRHHRRIPNRTLPHQPSHPHIARPRRGLDHRVIRIRQPHRNPRLISTRHDATPPREAAHAPPGVT
jgi:hypothetical protein